MTHDSPFQRVGAGAENRGFARAAAEHHNPRCHSNSDNAITEDL
jgi:hypothetical protein